MLQERVIILFIIIVLVVLAALVIAGLSSRNNAINPLSESNITGGADPRDDKDCLKKHFETIIRRMSFPGEDLAEKVIVEYFYADWCPWCVKMRPIWNRVKAAAKKDKKFANYVFIEHNQDDCNTPGITGIPKIVKYFRGKIDIFVNEYDYNAVYDFIRGK